MSSSQHRASRCVFVGNIPYDATEEQLVQICEEVGPVVSFRLVVDRETGKPKGYGFCEFRDEETALSARRNLQGYEINGRQLRVDFAENEKGGGVDRSREQQGRGGPGLQSQIYSYDSQKQPVGVVTHSGVHTVDNILDQPIGYQAAKSAASVMAGALGGSQLAILMGQAQGTGQMNGPSQANGSTDSLTSHLANMTKQQLYDIMVQMKALIQQNQQQARQILVANPPLTKALFQAQIMLGMVKPSQGGGATQQQPQTSQPPLPVISQQPPLLQSQPRPTIGAQAQSISLPALQQQQQSLPQMQFQGSAPPSNLALAYQQHGQPPSHQSMTQQAYQQLNPNIASRMGGEMGGAAMVVSGAMLGGNIGMGPGGVSQSGRVPGMTGAMNVMMTSGLMHHASQAGGMGGVTHAGAQIGGPLGMGASGMGLSMSGGLMGSDANPRIAYGGPIGAAGEVGLAGSASIMQQQGYGQLQMQVMQQPMGQGQPQLQAQSQSQQQVVQLELEQQKALLQQVMNLTPEQINSLPMEQRQQVLQLQQALR